MQIKLDSFQDRTFVFSGVYNNQPITVQVDLSETDVAGITDLASIKTLVANKIKSQIVKPAKLDISATVAPLVGQTLTI